METVGNMVALVAGMVTGFLIMAVIRRIKRAWIEHTKRNED